MTTETCEKIDKDIFRIFRSGDTPLGTAKGASYLSVSHGCNGEWHAMVRFNIWEENGKVVYAEQSCKVLLTHKCDGSCANHGDDYKGFFSHSY